ncbi:NADPH-dependent 7-cyano-7-deazaguanine reductase QueF [Herbaspirillum sp. alder98]|uniref:NADPH-dependent 7-cyano-7-deazaguanine reductase QueF n=1 Tax=Herbaspirillum sp. alder98 TaxID=2913096 RepID=UPI001CD87416|nr:NADPH-dependent 7-cyano-7-deazaguanine reductase QueF [Herbaspirillum sp. alder98]MCA1324052.1 NADPH-dependent 7-cyano-7-deazaguanine reductase QueF [Herbaspirillum sp. alder98]
MNHAATDMGHSPETSPLGKHSAYPAAYDPALLFPIPRAPKRAELQITGTLPFFGVDIWTAYEISWLNLRGKPQIAIATFMVPADSPNIIESKSFKLYLNSFNQARLDSSAALVERMRLDLSAAAGAPVQVTLTEATQFGQLRFNELGGLSLDRLDIEIEASAHPDGSILRADHEQATVEETFVSHLLKSNCPVTSQPDWGSVQIHYVGAPIDQEQLLKYIIGFRDHNEFHEQCVERIFSDILQYCRPQKLAVYARYTRRGGLDINPWRSNFSSARLPSLDRNARQ